MNTANHLLVDEAQNDTTVIGGADHSAETKAAFRTTDLVVHPANRAWIYATLLTIGYVLTRGLAETRVRAHGNA